MLVVIRKPAREKQPVRAALHLISRQHEKAFKEPRVSLTVTSPILLKPDRSRPFSNIIQKEKRSRKQSCLAPKHISTSARANATHKIQKKQKYAERDFTKHQHLLLHPHGPSRKLKKNVQSASPEKNYELPPITSCNNDP